MKSPATVRAIADPTKRAKEASELARQIEAKLDAERARRDMAVVVARMDHGVPPVTLYRELDVSRGLVNRMLQRAPAQRPTFDDPVKEAKAAQRAVKKHEPLLEEILVVRDDTLRGLMNGAYGERPISNADAHRLSGLTTARIAQIRKEGGYSLVG